MSWFADIQAAFVAGGAFMYPIAVLGIVVMALTVERVYFLFVKTHQNRDLFLARMRSLLLAKDLAGAVKYAGEVDNPVGRVVWAGLVKVHRSDDHVQAAMDEAALEELPKIERLTSFLPMLSNVATLLGLLGTIAGLIRSFAGVADADAATKAMMLSRGISEAMNCTAFGLVVAIPALIFYAMLQSRTQRVIDEINAAAVSILNLVVLNREALGITLEGSDGGVGTRGEGG